MNLLESFADVVCKAKFLNKTIKRFQIGKVFKQKHTSDEYDRFDDKWIEASLDVVTQKEKI